MIPSKMMMMMSVLAFPNSSSSRTSSWWASSRCTPPTKRGTSSWWPCRRIQLGWIQTTSGSSPPPSNGQWESNQQHIICDGLSGSVCVCFPGLTTSTRSECPSPTGSPGSRERRTSPSRCRRSSTNTGRWWWTSLRRAFLNCTTRSPPTRRPNKSKRGVSLLCSSSQFTGFGFIRSCQRKHIHAFISAVCLNNPRGQHAMPQTSGRSFIGQTQQQSHRSVLPTHAPRVGMIWNQWTSGGTETRGSAPLKGFFSCHSWLSLRGQRSGVLSAG